MLSNLPVKIMVKKEVIDICIKENDKIEINKFIGFREIQITI